MEQRLKFTLNKVTAKRHHRQHFSFNSIFFLSKLETPSGEYQHLARRSQQFWRDKESLCLTTSFIAGRMKDRLWTAIEVRLPSA
jgi:rhamnogalacturonyl hydrolase YesR